MELDQSLKNSEMNVTDDTASNFLLGPLLPLFLNSNSRKKISNRDWQGWLSSAQSGPAIDLTLAELCADIHQVAPDKIGTLKLRDVLSTASAHDMNEPPAHGVRTDLLIVCTVWAAFKNKHPCETFESHLAKLDNLKAAVRADLALAPKMGEGKPQASGMFGDSSSHYEDIWTERLARLPSILVTNGQATASTRHFVTT